MESPIFNISLQQNNLQTDHGLFGPDSVTWKVWSHPAAIVGAMRSFVTEMLSSADGSAAVADSGGYARDPIGRLQRTMFYFLTIVFGDTASVHAANDRINRVHAKVRGVTPLTGHQYSGQDPLLMVGVHLMTWHSVYYAYEKLVGKLPPTEEAQYFKESIRAAEALKLDINAAKESAIHHHGLSPILVEKFHTIPADRESYHDFFEMTKAAYVVTPQGRNVVNMILYPHKENTDIKTRGILSAAHLIGTAAMVLLPREMRHMAGLPTSRRWEVTTLSFSRTLIKACSLPPVWQTLQQIVSPKGYSLMNIALERKHSKE